MNKRMKSRRSFLTDATKAAIGVTFIPNIITAKDKLRNLKSLQREKDVYSANDQIQIALIGSGGMGVADATTAISVPGIKLLAVCDLYDGRLAEAKKTLGK